LGCRTFTLSVSLPRPRNISCGYSLHLVIAEDYDGAPKLKEVAVKVSDCMTYDIQIANPEHTIQDVAQAMGRPDAGVVPVGENDRLVGMITDRDIAIRGVALGKGPEAKIRDVMSTDVKYCFDDEDVEAVLHNMGELQVRRLPVLNRTSD
jgi:CBS domain-containing protein